LDGFGGFLERGFRLHDFHLGRLNAQRFFHEHFRLPGAHPLFSAWSPAQRRHFADAEGRLPVLPLLGGAAEPLPAPPWPRLPPGRLEHLAHLLRRRSLALLPLAVEHLLARSSRPMRWITRLLARQQSRGWVAALVDHIRQDLLRRGQLRPRHPLDYSPAYGDTRMKLRPLFLAAGLAVLAACSSGRPKERINPPALSIQELRLEEGRCRLHLRLHNHSSVIMRFREVRLDALEVDGRDLAPLVFDA